MSRNIKKESEWLKNNYMRFEARLPKDLGDEFKRYLSENNISFNEFIRNIVLTTLKK